jgi:hypothetical protein
MSKERSLLSQMTWQLNLLAKLQFEYDNVKWKWPKTDLYLLFAYESKSSYVGGNHICTEIIYLIHAFLRHKGWDRDVTRGYYGQDPPRQPVIRAFHVCIKHSSVGTLITFVFSKATGALLALRCAQIRRLGRSYAPVRALTPNLLRYLATFLVK